MANWEQLFNNQRAVKRQMYPEAFVLRAFLSGYPFRMVHFEPGQRVLDLSCGYGRNLDFLQSLGLTVSATEITESFVEQLTEDFPTVEFAVGTCQSLPFQNEQFDGVVACNSCYYLDETTTTSIHSNVGNIFKALQRRTEFLAQ